MAKRLLLFLLPVALVISCKFGMSALEYNKQMTTVTDSLFTKGKRWGNKLVEVMPEKRFAELQPLREDMLHYIDSATGMIKQQDGVKGSTAFKKAMLDFMDFEREYVSKACAAVEAMNGSTSDEEVRSTLQEVLSWADKEETYLIEVRKEQTRYAGKNGFKISSTKPAGT